MPSGFTISFMLSAAFSKTLALFPVVAEIVRAIFDVERSVTDISSQIFPPFTLVCTDRDWVNASFGVTVISILPSFLIVALAPTVIFAVTVLPDTESFTVGRCGWSVAFIPASAYTPSPYISSRSFCVSLELMTATSICAFSSSFSST